MKITNKHNYPQTLVDAVSFDSHRTEGDISVTTLINPPQVRYLRKKYGKDQEQDVSDMIWALLGTAIHGILERANITEVRRQAFMEVINALKEHHSRYLNKNLKPEETEQDAIDAEKVFKWLIKYMFKYFPELESRYMYEVTLKYNCRGWVVSGTIDLYDKIDKVLWDYKVTSVWMWIYSESRTSWKQQQNIYVKFLRANGYEVNAANIVAIFRDWNKHKAFQNAAYPKRQVMTIPIALYDDELITRWIDHRVKLHQEADNGIYGPCTGEEMWETKEMFAVVENGKKKAMSGSVTDRREVAEMFIQNKQHAYKKPLELRVTPGERRKCENYCNVSEFCDQFKEYKVKNISEKSQPDEFTSV